MKKHLLVLGAALLANASHAMYYGPILTVTKSPGFTLPEYRMGTQCGIYPDKLEMKRFLGDKLRSVEVRNVKIDFAGVSEMIDKAAQGPVKQVLGPTDVPITTYTAIQIGPLDHPIKTVLSTNGPQGQVIDSREAKSLINFIDMHCN